MATRKYRLESAREKVLQTMALRRPQRDAFDKVHDLFGFLDADLPQVDRDAFLTKVRELHPKWFFVAGFPNITIALATGVGKTRLMGALAAYLYLANQSANFLFLAPRAAILRKFEEDAYPGSRKYLFVNPSLLPAPRICFRGNVESFDFDEAASRGAPNLFIFSPQSFVGSDKRVARASTEFSGSSVVEFLKSRDDLVVFADEAHHLGGLGDRDAKAWTQVVRDLSPRMQIGMTATPRDERGDNLVYSYDLSTCLREKLYTKGVRVIVRERSNDFTDSDWDHHTLDFALDRLERKIAAIAAYTGPTPFPKVTPVLLVCAVDTAHANEIERWLKTSKGLGDDEVLVTHSEKTKTEDDITRLVQIEQTTSTVKVIVNVYELTEGWDVTNVFVVAPLRRLGTFQGAVQTIGRGLRLPAGRRVDDPELDTLDVLCFGKQSLKEVLAQSLKDFGDKEDAEGGGVAVKGADDVELSRPKTTKTTDVAAKREFEISLPTVHRIPVEPDLDFDPGALRSISAIPAVEFELGEDTVAGTTEGLKYPRDVFTRLVAGRVGDGLSYVSEPLHRKAIELLAEKFLLQRGIVPDASVELDWMKVAEFLKEQIDGSYRRKTIKFKLAEGVTTVSVQGFRWNIANGQEDPRAKSTISEWDPALYRRLISGWQKCTHDAAAFDSSREYGIASLLDSATAVDWWFRNDPTRLRIPTPIGYYEPDFVVAMNTKPTRYVLIECKRGDFWKPPESDARVKAASADAWCAAVNEQGHDWEHWLVLDVDVPLCKVIEDLKRHRANS